MGGATWGGEGGGNAGKINYGGKLSCWEQVSTYVRLIGGKLEG